MYFKSFSVVLIIALTGFHSILCTTVNSCKTGLKPQVNITGCDNPPCDVKLGTSEGLSMSFRSPCYLENAYPYVLATALDLTIPYPLGQSNICEGVTNTPCPLAENEYIEYHYEMSLPIFIPPSVAVGLEFGIKDRDQNDKIVVCFSFDAITVR